MFSFRTNSSPGVTWLVVGLGNMGAQYDRTRHNVGFDVIDLLADQLNIPVQRLKFKALTNTATVGGEKVLLMKPVTYMNLSGEAVEQAAGFYKIPPERVIVVSDEVALPPGKLRVRPSGSAGGHNGLKNIAQMLGTDAYPRLRFGIGNDFPRGCQIDYVLGQFTLDERQRMPVRIDVAVDAVRTFVLAGLQTAMCDFNNK